MIRVFDPVIGLKDTECIDVAERRKDCNKATYKHCTYEGDHMSYGLAKRQGQLPMLAGRRQGSLQGKDHC